MEGPPRSSDFMVDTKEGAAVALELWMLAKGTGTRPCDLLGMHRLQPMQRLSVDLTVMRAARELRRVLLDSAGSMDKTGNSTKVNALRMLALE